MDQKTASSMAQTQIEEIQMTLRERIEKAARELEQAASKEDEGVTLTWNRTTAINFALAEIEKATADLLEALDVAIKDREYFHAKLELVLTQLKHADMEEFCARCDVEVAIAEKESERLREADRQAREEERERCASIVEDFCQYCTRLCTPTVEDVCVACRAAEAIRTKP